MLRAQDAQEHPTPLALFGHGSFVMAADTLRRTTKARPLSRTNLRIHA